MTPETIEKKIVKQYLDIKKYFHHHLMAGLGSFVGTPDMIAVKNGNVYFIEVKKPGGKMSAGQTLYQMRLEAHGGNYICGTANDIIDYLDATDN